jgi:DNA-binding CsgD family transcriptional regulator
MAVAGIAYGVRKKKGREEEILLRVSGGITLGAILRRLKEMLI